MSTFEHLTEPNKLLLGLKTAFECGRIEQTSSSAPRAGKGARETLSVFGMGTALKITAEYQPDHRRASLFQLFFKITNLDPVLFFNLQNPEEHGELNLKCLRPWKMNCSHTCQTLLTRLSLYWVLSFEILMLLILQNM